MGQSCCNSDQKSDIIETNTTIIDRNDNASLLDDNESHTKIPIIKIERVSSNDDSIRNDDTQDSTYSSILLYIIIHYSNPYNIMIHI